MLTRPRFCSVCDEPLEGSWPDNLHIRIRWDLEQSRKVITWTCSDYEGPPPEVDRLRALNESLRF